MPTAVQVSEHSRLVRWISVERGNTVKKLVKVIPCLDMKDGRVVKGIKFVNLRDARDPVEAARDL